jgi:hypothetical protein
MDKEGLLDSCKSTGVDNVLNTFFLRVVGVQTFGVNEAKEKKAYYRINDAPFYPEKCCSMHRN